MFLGGMAIPPGQFPPGQLSPVQLPSGGGCPGVVVQGGLSRGICSSMAHGIFGANSSFRVKLCPTGRVSVFREFSASIGKAFILAGGLGTGLAFYGMV